MLIRMFQFDSSTKFGILGEQLDTLTNITGDQFELPGNVFLTDLQPNVLLNQRDISACVASRLLRDTYSPEISSRGPRTIP